MVDPKRDMPEDLTDEPVQASELADGETPETEAIEPVICDPVIGFVCPKHAALKG